MSRRRSYNDESTRTDTQPDPPSNDCSAFGCPLPAGNLHLGKRLCCVHVDVQDWNNFPAATHEICKRVDLVAAIEILRQPGFRFEAQTIEEACSLWPELSRQAANRYQLLLEAEGIMRRACLTGSDSGYSKPAANPEPNVVTTELRKFIAKHRMPA